VDDGSKDDQCCASHQEGDQPFLKMIEILHEEPPSQRRTDYSSNNLLTLQRQQVAADHNLLGSKPVSL
jgi:hypothetical protein